MPSDPSATLHLGRDTALAVASHDFAVRTAGYLPRTMLGVRPPKSPDNVRYINRRYCAQLIGDCTGEAFANCVQTLIRMPADRSLTSSPLPRKDLSALYAYWQGRQYGIRQGVRFQGEGGIGSFVAFAAKTTGIASLEAYPPTAQNYASCSDSRRPPAAALAEGPQHLVLEAAVIPGFDAVLDHLGAGYVCMVGLPIPQGFMGTDDSGRFRMAGNEVGGHEVVIVDYDTDKDVLKILNSWGNGRWGALENDPEQDPQCQGYNNVGWCTITEFRNWIGRYAGDPGAVEYVAVNNVSGWSPKIVSLSDAY